jgi:hypothetical protein
VHRVSRGIDRIGVTFDDGSLVANAGLLLVATVSARLGVEAVIDRCVRLVGRAGGARPGRKVLTLVHAMAAGADCIDDADLLRSGATAGVLPHRVMAPSTLGTFLRAFTFGHVRRLEAATAEVARRAWAAGAGPGPGTVVVDIDSTVCEVHGPKKQGARWNYTRVRAYHPLLATLAASGEVLHARLRSGSARSSQGVVRFVAEVVARLRRAGVGGPIVVRADAGFYLLKLLATFSRLGVGFTVTAHMRPPVMRAIQGIDERAWQRVEYAFGVAEVADCLYAGRRLVVRRVRKYDEGLRLFPVWDHHAFVTNLAGPAWRLDAFHRDHAVVELSIRDLKAGPLAHLPSGSFAANGAWLAVAVLAHNLLRWTAVLGGLGAEQLVVAKSFRRKWLAVPGRLVRPGGRPVLRLPSRWPWASSWSAAIERVRLLPQLC